MNNELKVVIVLLLVTQFLLKAIHGLVTIMNIFGAETSLNGKLRGESYG